MAILEEIRIDYTTKDRPVIRIDWDNGRRLSFIIDNNEAETLKNALMLAARTISAEKERGLI